MHVQSTTRIFGFNGSNGCSVSSTSQTIPERDEGALPDVTATCRVFEFFLPDNDVDSVVGKTGRALKHGTEFNTLILTLAGQVSHSGSMLQPSGNKGLQHIPFQPSSLMSDSNLLMLFFVGPRFVGIDR